MTQTEIKIAEQQEILAAAVARLTSDEGFVTEQERDEVFEAAYNAQVQIQILTLQAA